MATRSHLRAVGNCVARESGAPEDVLVLLRMKRRAKNKAAFVAALRIKLAAEQEVAPADVKMPTPDPERWLPKYERAAWKKRHR